MEVACDDVYRIFLSKALGREKVSDLGRFEHLKLLALLGLLSLLQLLQFLEEGPSVPCGFLLPNG